jgi:predicted ATPase/DNA-binding SARP family transcriptional activator
VSELRFAMLGPVRAWQGETELDLGAPQQRAVLAVLLLAEGRQVPASVLVDALWGTEPPKAAAGTVRTYISRLRQALAVGGRREVIESAGTGYLLPVQPNAVDLNLFLKWTAEARAARSTGDAAQAAVFLRDALGLWRGEALAGLPGEYAESQRARLTELQIAAVEDRLALEIELGGHVAAVAELQPLVAAHPLRERLTELLMLALYRAGRQADALAVFGNTRNTLSEELGIDPGPALRDMHQRILQTDESLISMASRDSWPLPVTVPAPDPELSDPPAETSAAAGQPAAAAPSPAGTRGKGVLPVSMTSLLGREQAIDEVAGLVEQAGARLVTLTGPGGVGKTRLAMAVAQRLSDRFAAGAVFVPLGAVTDPGRVLDAIGRAVGADLSQASAPIDALAETFGDGAWLLIVDNLEQVVEGARDLGQLLCRCPGLAIVATSRAVLGLRAEQEYPVPPLPVPPEPGAGTACELGACPAVALFVDRARAVRPGFALTEDNAAAVAEICQRLEGLPLAIELAAARTRLLDPGMLLVRLSASFDALGKGAVDLPERQRTLRSTVEWSVSLLDDAERDLLEAAAVFVDGWTLQAAAAVAGLEEHRALELFEALSKHSLVEVSEFGGRSRMLEIVRAFMAERLAARPDAGDIRRRHAQYYRTLAEQADRPLYTADSSGWLERLQAEAGNLAAAMRWYLDHDRRPLPHLFFRVLWLFWAWGEFKDQARSWLGQVIPADGPLDLRARAELTWAAAAISVFTSDDTTALDACERLEPLIAASEDPYLHALSQLAKGWRLPKAGDLDGAAREVGDALDKLRWQRAPFFTHVAAFTLASIETALGRYEDASEHLGQASNAAEKNGGHWFATGGRVRLAILDVRRGRLEEGRQLLAEALDLGLAIQSPTLVALCLSGYAQLAFAEDEPELAATLEGAAQGLRQRSGMSAWAFVRPVEAQLVIAVQQRLGTDRFDQLLRAGSMLTQREAVATVLDWLAEEETLANQCC